MVFSFTTSFANLKDKPDDNSVDTVTDIDGNVYKTVKIGTQVWIAENLKTTRYNDGTAIPYVATNKQWKKLETGAFCNYDNIEINGIRYGRLYNWYAVETGKLAPKGWHVPTDAEWTELENYLIANGGNYDGTTTVNKLAKSLAATTEWSRSKRIGAIGNDLIKNNSSGFTALPVGGRDEITGHFDGIGNYCCWWTSTEHNIKYTWYRCLNSYCRGLNRFDFLGTKKSGFSVRCVRD